MFLKKGNRIYYSDVRVESMNTIPVGNWMVKFDDRDREYYLEKVEEFEIPLQIYGGLEQLAERYINTYNNGNKNLGICLSGPKGSGKSLCAKITSIKANIPVILIPEPFTNYEFKSFMNNINQRCVIFLDEFEKVYHKNEDQEAILSILDGMFEGKKLFIFTTNEMDRMNKYLFNRPGRIHYLQEWKGLEEGTIQEIINDNLKDTSHTKELMEVLNIIGIVTMDILLSLIREMNLYNESPKEAIKYLNIKPDESQYKYTIFKYKENEKLGETIEYRHPLANEDFSLEFMGFINGKREWFELESKLGECDIEIDGKIIIITMKDGELGKLTVICKPKEKYYFTF